jgi:copper chaperone
MNTYKFKTSINCGACVARVTGPLNGLDSINKWDVDTENPEKILTVETENIDSNTIIETLSKIGFKAESV